MIDDIEIIIDEPVVFRPALIDEIKVNGASVPVENKVAIITITKSTAGLSNVDNTSDMDKPISTAMEQALGEVQDEIDGINSKIPTEASSSNKLADKNWVINNGGKVDDVQINGVSKVQNKIASIIYETTLNSDSNNSATAAAIRAFVNSSINALAAYYITSNTNRDAFTSHAQLVSGPWYYDGSLRTPTKNDYAIVTVDETHDNNTSRYVYGETGWSFQYTFNMQFTQSQINALNSGIDATKVSQIQTNSTKLAGIEDGAEVNILEGVKDSFGNDLSITDKKVQLSKNAVGLSEVDNTSDANKPVSIAVGQALDVLEDNIGTKVSFQQWSEANDEFQKRIDNSALELEILRQEIKGYGLEVGDETFENLSKEQLPSSITVDGNPYPIIDDVRTLVGEIDGETRNVNQLVGNGNFSNITGWSCNYMDLSSTNNVLNMTVNTLNSQNQLNYIKDVPIIEGHRYLLVMDVKFNEFLETFAVGMRLGASDLDFILFVDKSLITQGTWQRFYGIMDATGSDASYRLIKFRVSTVNSQIGDTVNLRNFQLFDLTEMFGAEMASTFTPSRILTDESADIIRFKKLMPKLDKQAVNDRYYEFTTGTNYSPSISKVKFYDAGNVSVGEISLPQKYTLSGTQKLVITKNATELDPSNPYYTLSKYDGDTSVIISSNLTLNEVSAIRKNGGYIEVVGNDNIDYARPTVKLKTAYKKANA